MGTNRLKYQHLLQSPTGLSPNNYGSVNNQQGTNIEGSILEGLSVGGRMSMARKLFILMTVFDVLFSLLMWIICTVVSAGSSIENKFKNEVMNYNIESSLFDVVVLSVTRLVVIMLFYVILRLSDQWVIVGTTAGTTIFIITKVFLYKWVDSGNTPAAVVLLVSSFLLSWAEAWFLGFRVLPSEHKALSFLERNDEEQAPVLSHPQLSRSLSDDGSSFYSPPGSDGEDNEKEHDGSTVSEVEWLSPKNSKEIPSGPDKTVERLPVTS